MKRIFVFLLILLIFLGCAASREKKRIAELEAQINPLIGKTQEQVVEIFGVPDNIKLIGELEVYYYYIDQGKTPDLYTPTGYKDYAIITEGEKRYDKIWLFFRDGILESYKMEVNR